MTSHRLMLACAGVALVLAIVATRLWWELRDQQATVVGLRAELATYGRAGVPHGEPSRGLIEQSRMKMDEKSAANDGNKPAAAEVAILERELLKDPEYRAMRIEQVRLRLPQEYPGLIDELGLSPQEAEKIFDMLAAAEVDGSIGYLSTNTSQPEQGLLDELAGNREEVQSKLSGDLAALLGYQRFDQWRTFRQSLPIRHQVVQVSRTLESLGHPLSNAQSRSLTEAFLAEQEFKSNGLESMLRAASESMRAGSLDREAIDELEIQRLSSSNRRILDAAAPGLNYEQLESLRVVLDGRVSAARITARIRRLQASQ